jgi:hypothetical protein
MGTNELRKIYDVTWIPNEDFYKKYLNTRCYLRSEKVHSHKQKTANTSCKWLILRNKSKDTKMHLYYIPLLMLYILFGIHDPISLLF